VKTESLRLARQCKWRHAMKRFRQLPGAVWFVESIIHEGLRGATLAFPPKQTMRAGLKHEDTLEHPTPCRHHRLA
jgi:hypothetical protein